MQKTCYVIDTNSVGNRWGYLLRTIKPTDEILAFFNGDCPSMTLGFINAMLRKGTHIELISRVVTQKFSSNINFQLVTEIGFRIAKHPELQYILVSENAEYEPLIEYWQQQEVDISRFNIITSKPEEISMSYNHRPNDPIRNQTHETVNTKEPAQVPETEPIEAMGPADEPETTDTQEPAQTTETPDKQTPESNTLPRYATNKQCKQDYYVRLNKLRIPAQRSKQIAEIMVPIMTKPANQRMLNLYNALSSEFGKKSGFVKTHYQAIKMLVAEIGRMGPLPDPEQ